MSALLSLTALALAAPAACSAPQRVELDTASFVRSDVPAFAPARLEAFRSAAAEAFAAAATAACAAGDVAPARFAPLRRLLIQSGSGATEATFYEDPEIGAPGTLIFQYVFAEENLALPEASDIRVGLACWANPARDECTGREP